MVSKEQQEGRHTHEGLMAVAPRSGVSAVR